MQNFPVPASKQRVKHLCLAPETVLFLWKQLCELHTQSLKDDISCAPSAVQVIPSCLDNANSPQLVSLLPLT